MNFPFQEILILLAAAVPIVVALSCIGFIVSLFTKNNGYADVLYPWYFIVVTGFGYVLNSVNWGWGSVIPELIPNIILTLVLLWGVRLSVRIGRKNFGKLEDFRYAKWRNEWTWFKTRSFFQIYLLQGLIALIIVLPAFLTTSIGFVTQDHIPVLLVVGLFLWLFGFVFESVGDAQLDRFIKDKNRTERIMTTGLWKYSRHPNYFGEATMWWAIWSISLTVVPEFWYLTILSPLFITFLLTKISGIPMLEKRWEGDPQWEAYKARTSALIPWPPKS